ncbi:hypothetical protein [Caballeronia sp. GAFFF3]|uniref:hypothetical protein n=1 Tax=Caballeronia sp. GAFFF3 TaxID=2921759 RepID=UPI0020285160|nr:hypothetical protein [Caballeronia sp. GAFFF3]
MHFVVTVLTDSLASSLTIVQLGALLRAAEKQASLRQSLTWMMTASVVMIIASCLRVEKLYLSVAMYLAVLVVIAIRTKLWKQRRNGPRAHVAHHRDSGGEHRSRSRRQEGNDGRESGQAAAHCRDVHLQPRRLAQHDRRVAMPAAGHSANHSARARGKVRLAQ